MYLQIQDKFINSQVLYQVFYKSRTATKKQNQQIYISEKHDKKQASITKNWYDCPAM